MIRLIVQDYLRNLKERDELDLIFPLLLDRMGYTVIKSAQSSHGQPEYGKDIIAHKFEKSTHKLFIFQLKAGADADLNNNTFYKDDGVRESLLQAKDKDFKDHSLPEVEDINKLKRKIILVHPGEIDSNFRSLFNDFIVKEFEDQGIEFERWSIHELPKYFSDHLLNEYLFSDESIRRLFQKSIAFLDVPENDYTFFKKLTNQILSKYDSYSPKNIRKIVSTCSMISVIVLHYSEEFDNYYPARECLTFMLLKVWSWILEKEAINPKKVALNEFLKLFAIHFKMLDKYIENTIAIAKEPHGLFAEKGGHFEKIGFPIRSMDYIPYLIYYHEATKFLIDDSEERERSLEHFRKVIKQIIENNSGCYRPILDNHSVTITLVLQFFICYDEKEFANEYLDLVLNNISLIKTTDNRLPELNNNIDALIEYCSSDIKPEEYIDDSSYLIKSLFEFCIVLNNEDIFNEYWEFLKKELNLLTYVPPDNITETEYLLFRKELLEEGDTEIYHSPIDKSDSQESAYNIFKSTLDHIEPLEYQTDKVGLQSLRLLAHIYFKTPFFPDEWRSYVQNS